MDRKNLLFIFADQWRAGAMGFAGEDPVQTPNMDSFCGENCYADHCFSTFPVCSPHRASLMTGKYPLSCGFFTNCKTGLDIRLKDEEICLSDVLKENGYDTAYIGKWHLDEPEENRSVHPASGAGGWDAYTPPGPGRHHFDYWYSYGTLNHHLTPHYWKDTPDMIRVEQWSPEHETDRAIEYLDRIWKKRNPFAMVISWNPPHSNYDEAPEKYRSLYRDVKLKENVSLDHIHHHTGEQENYTREGLLKVTGEYYAAVSGLDEQFGRLIRYLKEHRLYDSTVVVLSADHGDMMGSHGLMGKYVWYEESIRIPFVVHCPGNKKRRVKTAIGSEDQMPTILGLLGLPVPDTAEGKDCSGYILGPEEDLDKAVFLEACPGGEKVVQQFRAEKKDPVAYGWRGIRTQDYTFVMELGYETKAKARRYLYHTSADPLQMHPLNSEAPENAELLRKLEQRVKNWMKKMQDPFYENWCRNAC
jgi:arylsulfatase A-like enzyme